MGIRLLPKDEIMKAQASERAQEIAEGLKISRRVDSLRELQASEEQNFVKYRNEALAEIKKEIAVLVLQKETLQGEIKQLEEAGKKELTKSQQEKLADWEKKLATREQSLIKRSRDVDLKEIDIALALQESKDNMLRQKNHSLEAQKLHQKATEEKLEAKRVLGVAKYTETKAKKAKQDMEDNLKLRANNLAKKEQEVKMREVENTRIAQELAQERIQLEDQRQTLERALARIKKNRLDGERSKGSE